MYTEVATPFAAHGTTLSRPFGSCLSYFRVSQQTFNIEHYLRCIEPDFAIAVYVKARLDSVLSLCRRTDSANMPEPLGNPVNIFAFVNANHAGNVVTRHSHTGIINFLQNSPILWLSRRQNTVETSTFGSEFVAMRVLCNMIIALRYKLRMFGIPLDGPAQVFCDNQVKNKSVHESVLTKKHNAANYHAVHEAVASGAMEVIKEDTTTDHSGSEFVSRKCETRVNGPLFGSIVVHLSLPIP